MDLSRYETDVFTIDATWSYDDYVEKMKATVDKMLADLKEATDNEQFKNTLRRLELTGIEIKEQTRRQRWDWVFFFSYKYVVQLLEHVRKHKHYKREITKPEQDRVNRTAGEAMHNVETRMDGFLEVFFKQRQAKQNEANVKTATEYSAALRQAFAASPHRGLARVDTQTHTGIANPSLYTAVLQACFSVPTLARECIKAAKARRAATPEAPAPTEPSLQFLAGLGELYIKLHSPPVANPARLADIPLRQGAQGGATPVDPGAAIDGALLKSLKAPQPPEVVGVSEVLAQAVTAGGGTLRDFFALHSQEMIICPKCAAPAPTYTPATRLALRVPTSRTVRLEDMFVQHGMHGGGTPLQLSEDWTCGGCGLQIPALQTVRNKGAAVAVADREGTTPRAAPPRVLAIALDRFDDNGLRVDGVQGDAVGAPPQPGGVWVPAALDLTPFTEFVARARKGDVRYKLRAVVNHTGAGLADGQFTTLGLRPPPVGKTGHVWVGFNAHTAAVVGTENTVPARNALAASCTTAVLLLYELAAFQPGEGEPGPSVRFNEAHDVKHYDPAGPAVPEGGGDPDAAAPRGPPPGGSAPAPPSAGGAAIDAALGGGPPPQPAPAGPDLSALRQQLLAGGGVPPVAGAPPPPADDVAAGPSHGPPPPPPPADDDFLAQLGLGGGTGMAGVAAGAAAAPAPAAPVPMPQSSAPWSIGGGGAEPQASAGVAAGGTPMPPPSAPWSVGGGEVPQPPPPAPRGVDELFAEGGPAAPQPPPPPPPADDMPVPVDAEAPANPPPATGLGDGWQPPPPPPGEPGSPGGPPIVLN